MKEHRLHCSAPPPPGKGICKTPTSQKGVRVGGFDGGVPGAGGGIAALLHWLHCCVAALLRSPPAVTGSDLAEWSAVICLGGGGPSISSLWGGHFVCVCGGGGDTHTLNGLPPPQHRSHALQPREGPRFGWEREKQNPTPPQMALKQKENKQRGKKKTHKTVK